MTERLIKGMYGHEPESKVDLFGLQSGQTREGKIVNRGGWYNKKGQELGYGDLSNQDLTNICNGLEEGELFIIVPERHSSVAKRSRFEQIFGRFSIKKLDLKEPGPLYVAEKCYIIVTKGTFYFVDRYDMLKNQNSITRDNLIFELLDSKEALDIIMKKE